MTRQEQAVMQKKQISGKHKTSTPLFLFRFSIKRKQRKNKKERMETSFLLFKQREGETKGQILKIHSYLYEVILLHYFTTTQVTPLSATS